MHKLTNAVFGVAVLLLFGAVLTLGMPGAAYAQGNGEEEEEELTTCNPKGMGYVKGAEHCPVNNPDDVSGGAPTGAPVVLVDENFDVVVVNPRTQLVNRWDTNPDDDNTATPSTLLGEAIVTRSELDAAVAPMYQYSGITDATDEMFNDAEPVDGSNMITITADLAANTQGHPMLEENVIITRTDNPMDGSMTYRVSTTVNGIYHEFTGTPGPGGTTVYTAQVGSAEYSFTLKKTPGVAAKYEFQHDPGTGTPIKVTQDTGGWFYTTPRLNKDEDTQSDGAFLNEDGEPVGTAEAAAKDKVYVVHNIGAENLVQGSNGDDKAPQILKRDHEGNYWLVYGRDEDGNLLLYGLGEDGLPNTADDIGNANGSVLVGKGDIGYRTVTKDNLSPDLVAEIEAIDASGIADNTAAITTNRTDIDANAAAIGDRAGKTTSLTEDVDTNTTAIATNRTDIDSNTTRITANEGAIETNTTAIGANTTAIGGAMGMISDNSTSIASLWEEVEDLEDDIEDMAAGVAMSLAMTNIPQLVGEQTFSVGVGVGFYDSEGAGAIGINARLSDNAVGRASVAFGGGEVGGGAGVSFSW